MAGLTYLFDLRELLLLILYFSTLLFSYYYFNCDLLLLLLLVMILELFILTKLELELDSSADFFIELLTRFLLDLILISYFYYSFCYFFCSSFEFNNY